MAILAVIKSLRRVKVTNVLKRRVLRKWAYYVRFELPLMPCGKEVGPPSVVSPVSKIVFERLRSRGVPVESDAGNKEDPT